MEFENMTNKEEFLNACEAGFFELEVVDVKENGEKAYRMSDKRLNTVSWFLSGSDNYYAISHSGNESFIVYCFMEKNKVRINEAYHNGKTYRAERFLKKFETVCLLANCFVQFGLGY